MGNQRLVVVSNRVPTASEAVAKEEGEPRAASGLVGAILPVMTERGGLWFGWSGRTTDRRPDPTPAVSDLETAQLATIQLSETEAREYYTGFANRILWPLFHSFPERVAIRRGTYGVYRRVNHRFAEALYPLLRPDDLVWVQDYHLFHLGHVLRQLGWKGKIGFFLHTPFPPAEVFGILPWAAEVLEGLMHYDLVGFQTERFLHNAMDALTTELGGKRRDGQFVYEDASVRMGVYPVGIDPALFQGPSVSRGRRSSNRLLLGVDRLDYSKGIPQRLRAFERLLEHNPSLRGTVTFTQISAPSRTRTPEYITEKEEVDQLVGQINGRFSEDNWTPIRYLYRSYRREDLVRFYRDAEVFLVTPLRDGMNLIAKEIIASQDDDPGVLVLSKFCGAAESLREALIVNPYDIDGTAEAINTALRMPKLERLERWRALVGTVNRETANSWAESFLRDLSAL